MAEHIWEFLLPGKRAAELQDNPTVKRAARNRMRQMIRGEDVISDGVGRKRDGVPG